MFELIASLQRRMIGLWLIDFRTRKFTYNSNSSAFKAVNTSKGALFPQLYCGVLSIIWISFLFQALYNKQFQIDPEEISLVAGIMFIISLASFRQFLWLIRGREEVVIEGDTLTIIKHGSFWMKPKVYQLAHITDIRSKQEDWKGKKLHPLVSENMQRAADFRNLFFRLSLGAVRFRHKNEQVRLFSNLTDEEMGLVIEEIKKRVIVYNNLTKKEQ